MERSWCRYPLQQKLDWPSCIKKCHDFPCMGHMVRPWQRKNINWGSDTILVRDCRHKRGVLEHQFPVLTPTPNISEPVCIFCTGHRPQVSKNGRYTGCHSYVLTDSEENRTRTPDQALELKCSIHAVNHKASVTTATQDCDTLHTQSAEEILTVAELLARPATVHTYAKDPRRDWRWNKARADPAPIMRLAGSVWAQTER